MTPPKGPLRSLTALTAALALLTTGCAAHAPTSEDTTVTVFAAASLQEPFDEIGDRFETEHPGTRVEISYAGSSTLAEQIRQGAPADVLATADEATMATVVEAGLADADPVPFATNTLMIAVPAGNPAGVTDLASLTEDGLNLVLCAPAVPCGAAAAAVESAAGLTFAPVSEEQSVTDVLTKVSSGEADAGLVYATDIRRAGDAVDGIGFPEAEKAVNTYPLTTVKGSQHAELGQDFVDLVLSEAGQSVLADHGFAGA